MRSRTCSRAWEAEAIEDGRLDELGAASFERHVAQCPECAEEVSTLGRMRKAFGELEPRKLSLLEQRRQRVELLRRANEQILTPREGGRRPWLKVAAITALIAVLVGAIGLERRHVAIA